MLCYPVTELHNMKTDIWQTGQHCSSISSAAQ